VTVALVPPGTTPSELADRGFSPGLLSAGLGDVLAAQTYLDASQGNRVFDSLYDSELPSHLQADICGSAYPRVVVERAESAPADIVPGLLAAALRRAGKRCVVRNAGLAELTRLRERMRGRDLLIALERAPPPSNEALAIGIAGRGFDGNLTSDSTRLDGYVLSTDVAPTILNRLGIGVPLAMSGEPIHAGGPVDAGAVEALGARMEVVSPRRGPVIGLSLLVWLGLLGATLAVKRGAAKPAIELVGLSVVYLPLTLLLGAALEPGQGAEQLLVAIGSPLLAALSLLCLSGYRALAVASSLVVVAYAGDVIAGSHLTSLSLLGPNPALGVRFYGIGNELEALLAVLVVAGTGAGLVGFAPDCPPRVSAAAFLAAGLVAAVVFAAGRFGADVGAAIVLPAGSAVAAATVAGRRRRTVLYAFAAPFVVLMTIALGDLLSGANAHLTRSVLEAGSLDEVADVAQRRLQLSARSFGRPIVLAFLPLVAALAVLALAQRDRLSAWLRAVPAMRSGLLGAAVATLVGTVVNDSGALVLEIGAAYLFVFTGFAWCEKDTPGRTKVAR
jgi:hypothetical protein